GDLYVTATGNNQILRFGTESEAMFTVSLATPAALTVTVSFSTADGTAIAGSDYTSTSGTLSFAPGVTSKVIRVPILNNTVGEPAEAFKMNLSGPLGAGITDGQGVATITDDDATKFFVVNDSTGGDRTYEYGAPGNALRNNVLDTGNTSPRGAAS